MEHNETRARLRSRAARLGNSLGDIDAESTASTQHDHTSSSTKSLPSSCDHDSGSPNSAGGFVFRSPYQSQAIDTSVSRSPSGSMSPMSTLSSSPAMPRSPLSAPMNLSGDPTALAQAHECKLEISRISQMLGNQVCADCDAISPQFASISLGIFICAQCCEVHRSLGEPYNIVRDVYADLWTPEQVEQMQRIGNSRSNRKFELFIPDQYYSKPKESTPWGPRHKFIHAKYVKKLFTKNVKFDFSSNREEGGLSSSPIPISPLGMGGSRSRSASSPITGQLKMHFPHSKSNAASSSSRQPAVDTDIFQNSPSLFEGLRGSSVRFIGALRIYLIGAKHLPSKKNIDPFCVFSLGKQEARSHVSKKSLSPYWGEHLQMYVENMDDHLSIKIYDRDCARRDAYLVDLSLDISHLMKKPEVAEPFKLFLFNTKNGQLHLELTFIPWSKLFSE